MKTLTFDPELINQKLFTFLGVPAKILFSESMLSARTFGLIKAGLICTRLSPLLIVWNIPESVPIKISPFGLIKTRLVDLFIPKSNQISPLSEDRIIQLPVPA